MHTQWLLIVQRNDLDLYVDLRAIFQPDARVATIIDRRWHRQTDASRTARWTRTGVGANGASPPHPRR